MNATTLVVFDLDRTITARDTQIPFIIGFLRRHPWRLIRTAHLPLLAVAYLFGLISNDHAKESLTRAMLGGVRRHDIEDWSKQFVERVVASNVRRQALQAIAGHRRPGVVLVLASASLDLYTEPLARRLGFEYCLSTRCAWTDDDRLEPNLAGPNLRGEAKAIAVQDLLTRFPGAELIVYSDHHSDIPLLTMADRSVAVNPTKPLTLWATNRRIPIVHWR